MSAIVDQESLHKDTKSILRSANATLDAVRRQPGLTSEILAKLKELDKRQATCFGDWHELESTLHGVRGPVRRETEDISREERKWIDARQSAQATILRYTAAAARKGGSRLENPERALSEAHRELEHAETELAKLAPDLADRDAKLEKAAHAVKEVLEREQQRIATVHAKAKEIADDAAALHWVVADRSLASQGEREIEVHAQEFQGALQYHRTAAIRILWLLMGLAVCAAVGIYLLFVHLPLVKTPPVLGTETCEPYQLSMELVILHVSTSLGGRIAMVVLVGWLVKFLSGLHSSHSQQAVIYQDRLAGLGAAKVIINWGQREAMEEVMKLMARSYVSIEVNAFRGKERPDRGPSLKTIGKIAAMFAKFGGEVPHSKGRKKGRSSQETGGDS